MFLAIAPDLIAPGGTITNPTAGSTKSGSVLVPTITATDDHGVAGVQWKLDGANLGTERTTPPFDGPVIDTRLYDDIAHTISADIRDIVNHHTVLANVSFNINNNPGGGTLYNADPLGGGGRRTYNFAGNWASPQYIDSTGVNWGGNSHSDHYKVQMRYTFNLTGGGASLEPINGTTPNHAYALTIGGVEVYEYVGGIGPGENTGWFDVSDVRSGAITFRDWATNTNAGSAYVGVVLLEYRYVWTH